MFRFSLSTLFIVLVVAALGCAALVNSNETWKQVTVTMTILTLIVFTIAAIAVENRRPFVVGFAVAGWAYLLIVFVSAVGLRNDLLTDKAVALLFNSIHGKVEESGYVQSVAFSPSGNYLASSSNVDGVTLWDAKTGQRLNSSRRYSQFSDIGHALWTLIVACLGGVCAELICRQKNSDVAAA